MGDAHRHLAITAEEWEAFMDDLRQAQDRFGVPPAEQAELRAIVEGTREAIAVAPLRDAWGRAPWNASARSRRSAAIRSRAWRARSWTRPSSASRA